MSRVLRVYCPDVRGPEMRLTLDEEESHHVTRVLRLALGDALSVFDGAGREWECVVEDPQRSATVIRVGSERSNPVEAGLDVDLFQGLCRPERVEWCIQKATEVGVASIRPCRMIRSEGPEPSHDRLARWRRVAREACKQCGRRRIPGVADPGDLPTTVPPGVLGLALHTGEDVEPIGRWLAAPRPEAVWLLAGPEGGLAEPEAAALVAGGWRLAGLGPRTLRAETAGVVAAAVILHRWDDLGRDPPSRP